MLACRLAEQPARLEVDIQDLHVKVTRTPVSIRANGGQYSTVIEQYDATDRVIE